MRGGSIIDTRFILAAAHCVEGAENQLQYLSVHAGTNYLNETGYMYKVANITIHENYNRAMLINDVALIRLATPIKYNAVVQPIKLAKTDNDLEGKPCTVSGWGITRLAGNTSNSLQEIDLIIYPQQLCRSVHSEIISRRICTFKAGQGACNGDSGSPLVANGIQIGIVSFVPPCAVEYLDIYTRVSSFGLWIWIEQVKLFVY